MPVHNPYDFAGQFGGGALSTPGANPYGGFLTTLLQQRQKRDQATQADALTKMRQQIAAIAGQKLPDLGALSLPTEPKGALSTPTVSVDPADVYNPDGYFTNLGTTESNNDYTVVNPKSGAGGKYQFIERTWNDVAKQKPELNLTPEGRTAKTPEGIAQQEAAARFLTGQNAPILKKELGRAPTHTELYIAHLLGPGYGSAVLRAPDTPVETLVPSSFVEANPFLKGIDGRTLVQMFAKKFAK